MDMLAGRNLVGGLGTSLLFSFHLISYPCTSSRVDQGYLEVGVGECPPFTIQVWKRGHNNEGAAQSGGALGTESPSGV